MSSFCKAIKGVRKELYIKWFEITEQDLQEIVKAASSTEKVVFRYCNVHCKQEMDFVIQKQYQIKHLLFSYSGDFSRKSDFKTNPSLFENIVEAIAQSGLRDSLETVDILSWGLKVTTVQQMFDARGMSHITATELGSEPTK